MATAAERGKLVTTFLSVVGQIERLAVDDGRPHRGDQESLERWRAVYKEEIKAALDRRARLLDERRGAAIDAHDLALWIEAAREAVAPVRDR